jgi:RNA polymerase sigma factor (sigma-70 family)
MSIKTDRELIESYATDRNDAAFAELVARYNPMVYRACLRVLGNAGDAEDATQGAFLVLVRKAGSLRQEGRLNGWLHRVARQVALQALRVRSDRERRQEHVAMTQESMTVDTPEIDREVVFQAVDAELDGLSAVLREALVLRYLRGLSEKEAAGQAGCPVSAMKWRASDGIAKLRQRLAKRGVALGGVALAGLLTSEASAAVPETLLPSILATVKTAAATTATATTATTTAAMLAKGAMKAMYLAKVKMVALVAAASLVVAGGGALVAQEVTQRKAAEQPVGDQTSSLIDKMARIIIPEIQFRQARMEDVVSFLNEASVTFDTITPVGQKKGVVLLLYPPFLPKDEFARWKEPSITLAARSISMLEVLRIVTESAGLTYWVGKEYARDCVRICRAGEKPPDSFRQQGVRQPAKTRQDTCDLVIPEVDFRHASLSNVVEVLTAAAKLHDPKKTGVRMIVEGPKAHSTYITLSARDVTLRDVLTTICMDTGMTLRIETHKDGPVVRLISGENTDGKKREPREPSKSFNK